MERDMQALALGSAVQVAKYSSRVIVKTILGRQDGGAGLAGSRVRVGGWVRTGRLQQKDTIAFLELNDGSSPKNLQVEYSARTHRPGFSQVLVHESVTTLSQLIHTGTCLLVEGLLEEPPENARKLQQVELKADKILEIGGVDAAKNPIAKTKLGLEYLRGLQHLRPRTKTIAAVARIRNALAFATHTFFQKNGFLYVHTPIITTSDCEGAGEMFQVTTLLSDTEKREKVLRETEPPSEMDLEAAKSFISQRGGEVKQLKTAKAGKPEIEAALKRLQEAKDALAKLEERLKLKGGLPQKEGGGIDYSSDFFARQAFLTVSGQLQVETYACCLSSVYTFGPTFRAENSHTTRHLAEFWMIEPELAFADIQDDMNCAEDYVRFMCQWLIDNCLDDMLLMVKEYDIKALERVKQVAATPFARITYTEAIELLEKVTDRTFENPVSWGIDLASEHERYLAEEHFQRPVIVYNYPKDIKAFYMRMNDDGMTVAAMDILVPKVGELIGGSQREERFDALVKRLEEMNLPLEPYNWYLDLRRYGTVKHAGFGLGFERMILFATGIENIRDVIPFPRYPGKAEF